MAGCKDWHDEGAHREMRFKRILVLLGSKELLIWLIILWIGYYLTVAIWWKEAFAHFVMGLRINPIPQLLYVAVIVNLTLRLAWILKEDKYKAFIKAPLLLGVVIFLSGFFMSIATRDVQYILLGEGERYSPPGEEYMLYVEKVRAPLTERYFDIEEDKGFFKYNPEVFLSDGIRQWRIVPYPPTRIGKTYFHILDFGIAPGIRLTEGEKVLEEGYMALRLLPPGSSDYFEVEPYPYRFYIKLSPDRVIEKGKVIGRSFNLKRPRYELKILKGDETIAEGTSESKLEFEGLGLSFFEPAYWVRMEVVRDIGLPFIAIGMILILIGIPLRFIRFRLKIMDHRL